VKSRFLLLALLAVAATSVLWAATGRQDGFPHLEHAGLFPLCTGCHVGIATGDSAAFYPDPEGCAGCHDGSREEVVEWSGPSRPPGNVVFSHPDHEELVRATPDADTVAQCGACHREPGAAERMAVRAAPAEACMACHAHEAPEHLAEGRDCETCHVAIVDAPAIPAARIADFPRPPSHATPAFLETHDPGDDASSCATCHARQSCTRCHLNAESLPAIRALEPDPRIAGWVTSLEPEYPVPETHRDPSWQRDHGVAAEAAPAACANCHVQANCQSCHGDVALAALDALPSGGPEERRGVRTAEVTTVHGPAFVRRHSTAAALEGETCSSCHTTTTFCESCHDGPASPAFHLPDFLERHGPEAYGRETDCGACHSTEVFCRACHVQAGLGSQGSLGVAFHSARPFWLLGHGTAARQGLEGCVTCHLQSDCAQCHSAVGGWGVNPTRCARGHRGEIPR
jgi:predicted CXXCH cytochrome family protein